MVALGSLLPFFIDLYIGKSWLGHSFLFSVALLLLIMLFTIGRTRMLRRKLLCISIGVFLALILEGSFLHEQTWWWPLNIKSQKGIDLIPSFGIWIFRDVIGLISIYILFSIGELYKRDKLKTFLKQGRITNN
ncbi:MAG: hypothetical protein U0R17_07395 [Acidimicrobiia bacterium]